MPGDLVPSTRADLHRALDATLAFGPTYAGATGLELASHLPMVLGALHRLGAPSIAFDRHLALWRPRLRPQGAADGPVPATPPAHGAPYAHWLRHLAASAEHASPDALVRAHLPALLAAPESASFHGPIRLAYACEAGHAGEIVHALAAWCAAFSAIDPASKDSRGDMPARTDGSSARAALRAALDEARADASMAMAPRRDTTILSDLQEARALPAFDAHAARVRPTLDDLAEASLAVYLRTQDFTALHLVTATHAMRTLLARVPLATPALADALRRFWRAWLAAWVSIDRPAPDWAAVHQGAASEADWDVARRALCAHGSDHAIKLADTAREEWRHRGWPGYARCLPRVDAEAAAP